MNSCKFTPFGLYVKTKLLQCGRTQKWLESEVNARTGMYVDDSYLYKIFTGQRNAPKISQAICEILQASTTDSAGIPMAEIVTLEKEQRR